MAVNLNSIVTQLLTPDVIAQIASFLGIDKSAAQKAAGATIPTILASVSDLVGTPAGANQLSKLLSQQQGGSPIDLLRNNGAQSLAQTGSNMLSGLFGGRTMDTMGQAIGRFAGTGDSGGKSLFSVVGPLVLGTLGQQQRDAGLDANGLASLLRSQKDQMVAAIPSGLADQLSAAGLIEKTGAGMRVEWPRPPPQEAGSPALPNGRPLARAKPPMMPPAGRNGHIGSPRWLSLAVLAGIRFSAQLSRRSLKVPQSRGPQLEQ
jgi:hypothetical protein